MKRAVDTIGNRIDQLGLAEKSVQQYGQSGSTYQILIQLPGVDDPARVKELIGTAAVLEITEVKEGPYRSREAALAQQGGILPLGTKLVASKPRGSNDGEQWYLVGKTPVVRGREMRNARARPGRIPQVGNILQSFAGRRQALRAVHGVEYRRKLAVVLDNQIVSVATIQSRIEDSGRITGLGSEEEAVDLSRYLRSGSLPAGVNYLRRALGRAVAGRGFDSRRASWRASPGCWR